MTPNIYQHTAKYWSDKGISTVPCYYRSKHPHSQALINSGLKKLDNKGEIRATWTPLKSCLSTKQQISQWFETDKKYNLALITTDKFVILDFDSPQEYAYWYCWQSEHNPSVLNTYIVTTSRGLHLYYQLEQPLTEPIKSREPYEIKSHGKLITIPPSVHPSGIPYRAINSPDKILTVNNITELLTFSSVKIKSPVIKRDSDPWRIEHNDNGSFERVDLLAMFPEAKETSEGYYICNCPMHGHEANFMLNTNDKVAYCFAGCGTFLFSELVEILEL